MAFPWSRSASNSGRRAMVARRRAGNPSRILPSAFCRFGSPSAFCALVLKLWLVASIARFLEARSNGRHRGGHVGEHLGDMAHADGLPEPGEFPGHIEKASHIAGKEGVGASGRDIKRLVARHALGDLRIFDTEGATEAAAYFRPGKLLERQPLDVLE